MNNETTNTNNSHPLKKDVSHHLPTLARYRKEFWSALVLIALVIAIALGSYYVRDRQELRQQASTDMVDLTFNPANVTLNEGETTQITVIMDTNTKTVSAVDLYINNSNPSVMEITNITKGSSNLQQGLPDDPDTTSDDNAWKHLSTNPTRFTLGVTCTETSSAGCNAQQTAGGQVATIHLRALSAGTANLSFTNSSQVAAIEVAGTSDDNVIGDLSTASLTVESTSTDTCNGADISADGATNGTDGRVDTNDYNYLVNNWSGFSTCGSCGGADISADGATNGTDNRVDTNDYNYLVNNWSGFSTCN